MRVKIDLRGIDKLQRDLQIMRKRALPHAVRQALNDEAFAGRSVWHAQMDQEFALRNRWTKASVRVDKARGTDLGRMRATLGSVADYVAEQEFGATVQKSAIPTGVASGEGRVPGSARKRPVRRPNRKAQIQLRSQSAQMRPNAAVAQAKRRGERFVLLERGIRRGIYRLSGGKRRTRLDLVHDLSRNNITKRPRPTLQPTVDIVRGWAPGIMRRALIAQFRRHNLPWK